ncbi:Crp/Fnr family transcriptional regulator [Mangrovibacterium diazotrophicum]|uniref:CRP-like cAMP-binding protein n=1 Tax=Mangrovibacterium diazotrophicum TaxID=1261403 RepID=A0A419VU59_9BACT|nr:Crp/Fnr family transcriptional regulator [Mangrovibacterium diazotrophicum]RKD85060.1 CRP-like cAMP-binding protein [Mangrovibacterium diazotrophicum]
MIKHRIDCLSCSNSECLIKKHCGDPGITSYLSRKVSIPARKGQNIIIEGSPIHGLYFVYSGRVKVLTTGINGREQILRFAKEGEMLGQRGFSTHQYYPIGASALEDTIVCNFSMEVMKEMLLNLPKLSYDFISFYAEELHRSETKVRMFAHMTVREKVIDALLYITRKFGSKKNFINITLSRKEIADFAGTTEEQVIRVLSSLKKEELILLSGKKIGVPDADILKKEIAEHHYFIQS